MSSRRRRLTNQSIACAQRLSASLLFITVLDTIPINTAKQGAQRLSASLLSSHQQRTRPAAAVETGAQRLSASLLSSRVQGERPWHRTDGRAQRLSASLMSSHRLAAQPHHRVLNAFRHHCCHHPRHRYSLSDLPEHRSVLNAFRHHCCHHIWQRIGSSILSGCSTPFGITAVVTIFGQRCHSITSASAQRLSASLLSSLRWPRAGCRQSPRAQRLSASLLSSHVARGSVGSSGPECSTPFGITAVITL